MTTERKLSPDAAKIMTMLVSEQGLSYDEALVRAERAATKAAAPYKEVAAYLRRWIEEHADSRLPGSR